MSSYVSCITPPRAVRCPNYPQTPQDSIPEVSCPAVVLYNHVLATVSGIELVGDNFCKEVGNLVSILPD